MRNRSIQERIIHAVAFEASAIVIVAPLAAWVMNKPLLQMGTLTILLSTLAMVWNMIYNSLFDRLYAPGKPRSAVVRVLHGLGFEGGFIIIGVPLVAWWLQVSLTEAFMLDVGLFLFYLPFTILYNWVYDKLRARIFSHLAQRHSPS